jgi:hypothetical protein
MTDHLGYPVPAPTLNDADCGLCLTPGDIGLPGSGIAYAHPGCPYHGSCNGFQLGYVDTNGRPVCGCGAYEDEHYRGGPA